MARTIRSARQEHTPHHRTSRPQPRRQGTRFDRLTAAVKEG